MQASFIRFKELFKHQLSDTTWKNLRNFGNDLKALGKGNDLNKLATIYGTDKWGLHFYTLHYHEHFRHLRNKKITLLEIGVGGHEDPKLGGNSLRMWKKYFLHGNINAIDIYDKSFLGEKRIKIFKGSQTDENFLKNVIKEIGTPEIIIDDGSHINEHVIATFKILFPLLKHNGIYVVEDTQTSYWPAFGGDSNDLKNSKTIANFFKALTDCLNHQEFILDGYEPGYFDKKISSMHFYHNLIFIRKGNNDEKSNKDETHIIKI